MAFPPHRERPSLIPGGFGLRLVAMLGALALIGATIYTLRGQFLAYRAAERAAGKMASAPVDPKTWKETIIPGPSDTDPAEREEIHRLLEVVSDQRPIEAVDNPAYIRMLKWAMSQPITELEERARRDVTFSDLAKQPEKYRAALVRMRMHVVRVMHDDETKVPENSLGLKNLYEVYTWTDDSMDNPYVVVVPELPPGIQTGVEASGEVVFVGYFLKQFAYEAFKGQHRWAPLLVGRIRTVGGSGGKQLAASRNTGLTAMLVGGGVLICVVLLLTSLYRVMRKGRRTPFKLSSAAAHSEIDVEAWLQQGPGAEPDTTAADRYSPAVATNGKAHHQNGDHPAEPGHPAE